MKKCVLMAMASMLAAVLVLSCAPRATPTAAPDARPVSTPAPVLTSNLPPSTPQEVEWQKVVEAAKKEGKLTVYSFSFVGDLGLALSKAFKDRYGIQMELVAGSGAVFLERLKVESRAGQRVADVLEGSATNGILAKKDGLTQPLGFLPAAAETGIWLFDPRIDPDNNLIGYSPSISTTWANTKLVSQAEEPKSWRDLLAPKWKGKMVVTEPDTMPLPTVYYIAFTRYMGLDDDYFRAIGKQDLIFTTTQRENDSKLIRGEAPLSFTSNLTSMSMLVAEGAPVKPLDMKEGVAGRVQTLNIVKDAAHPNAARVFINWLLSAEGQTIGARLRSTLPLRTDVQDFTPAAARVKYTKVFPLTPKDEDDNTKALRDRVVSKLWGR
ncbi:MAG: extracellular solute-binding protein [Dehalococcoidia bacterium]|nr:extracellular solute-binding protein [Dehalococcoidia bacterium]